MNNEFNKDNNNNQTGENPNKNPYYDNNQYSYDNRYQSNSLDYMKSNQGYQNLNDPSTQLIEGKKKHKKKHSFFGFAKLTAAAVAFGLIAGVVFQGYNEFTKPEEKEIAEQGDTDLDLVLEDITEQIEVDLVPTSYSTNVVVTDVSDIVEKVMPSIVAINSSGTATGVDFFGRQYKENKDGSGSGIIIGQKEKEILIVTNFHVIESAQTVEIVFVDDSTAKATVKGSDAGLDLAVLSVDIGDLTGETASMIKVATLGNSDEVKPGEMAIAIGNALGYGQSVTVGYISAVNRKVNIDNVNMNLLQTDAAINPGNSGGALISTTGEVIGINSLKFASAQVEGMGYAIPISDAIPMMNELMNREVIASSEQGFLGIRVDTAQNVTEVHAELFKMPIGIFINDVVPDSPAMNAGLKQGYIITKVGDRNVETVEDLLKILSYSRAGETITLTVKVKDNGDYMEKELNVTLGNK